MPQFSSFEIFWNKYGILTVGKYNGKRYNIVKDRRIRQSLFSIFSLIPYKNCHYPSDLIRFHRPPDIVVCLSKNAGREHIFSVCSLLVYRLSDFLCVFLFECLFECIGKLVGA